MDEALLDDTGTNVSPEVQRYRELLADARQEEVWFEGRGGPFNLYEYRISNRTVRVSRLTGLFFWIAMWVALMIIGGVIGVIATQGEGKNLEPNYILVAIIGGPCCLIGCVLGVCMGFKRITSSLETRLICDISLRRSTFQNLRGDGSGTLLLYTLDPTSPIVKAKIPKAEAIYEKILDFMYKRELGPDAPEPVKIYEKEYGLAIPGTRCCGFYGCLPTRRYTFRDWDLSVEERWCCWMRREHCKRESIYDISLQYSCFQLLTKKCLKDRATMQIMTLDDSSGGKVLLRLRDAEKEFDNLRNNIDCNNAADKWWQQTMQAGFVAGASSLST